MCEINEEIENEISELRVECPDCRYFGGDDQYTCTICWCEGGGGTINVLEWIKENKEILTKEAER